MTESRPITVTVTPTEDMSLLDCSSCGFMEPVPSHGVGAIVYDHLLNVHEIDTDTIDIRNVE